MFLVGSLPALLCIVVFQKLKEPERWQREAKAGARRGSIGELFSDPRWRYNAIVGMLLAFAGVVGLWGIGFFSFDLFRSVLDTIEPAAGRDDVLDRHDVAASERSARSSASTPSRT